MNTLIVAASLDAALTAIPRNPTLDEIVKAAAYRMRDVEVQIDSAFGTVCISSDGFEDIFMQGDDAEQFIAEVDKLYIAAQNVTEDEAALCIAEQYVECIWN